MQSTFDEFVVSRGAALHRFAYLLCGDRHLGEDLLQEVLARAHRKWAHIERVERPEAYVRASIVRQYLSWRRRRASTEVVVAAVPERTHAPDPADAVTARDEMWTLLATLPPAQRAVLILRYYVDLPDAEIAELLDCAVPTVRVHAFRAIARLRSALPGRVHQLERAGG